MCNEMSDDEALTDIRKGGQCGFVVLYRRYEPKVYNYVISKGVPESNRDDVIQEIFFQLFKTLIKGTFKQACSLSTWLYEITKNTVCDYWRQQQKTQSNLESLSQCEETEEEGNPFFQELSEAQSEKAYNDLESQICIKHILRRLSCSDDYLNNCLEVLLLQVQGESHKDIATLINRTVEATRKYISECSKKLRQYSPLRDCWQSVKLLQKTNDMSAQDDQDWLDLLAGKSVPHADPNTVREARIFRAALLAYADKEKVGKVEESYPPILAKVLNRLETEGYLQKAEPASTMSVDFSLAQIPPHPPFSKGGIEIFSSPVATRKLVFQQYDPLFSLAASLLIAVLIVVSQIPVPMGKSSEPCVNELLEPPPQPRIIHLQRELKVLGIASKIIQLKNGFRLKATLPTDRSPALQNLLVRYNNLVVLPESQYLCVNFLAEESP